MCVCLSSFMIYVLTSSLGLLVFFFPSGITAVPCLTGQRGVSGCVFVLHMSSWLYLAVSAADQEDKQTILSNFSCEVLFSFFKGSPRKILWSDLCANKLSASKQASYLPWIWRSRGTLHLISFSGRVLRRQRNPPTQSHLSCRG